MRNRSCRQFFPLAGRGKAVEVDERNAVDYGVANLDYTAESGQGFFIDLFVGQKFRVIEEIAQEPAQLPHRLLRAVEATHDGLTRKGTRFKDGESEDIERFAGMPAELGAVDTNQEDPNGNLRTRIAGSFGESWDLAFHATTVRRQTGRE